MKPDATLSKPVTKPVSRRYKYTKVCDNRKHTIRGLWKRNGKFLARITVEDEAGRKSLKWVPLEAETVAKAQEQLGNLLVQRRENELPKIGRTPTFSDYVAQSYRRHLATSGKKPDTLVTEEVHLKQLEESFGHLHLDKIRPQHVNLHLQKLKERGKASRTRNLALVVLRNVLKLAKVDGLIKTLPVEGIPWQRTEKKSRRLYSPQDITILCEAGLRASKNGQEFSDYLRLMALAGSREQETIKLPWKSVDFERKLLCIGADADTKSREARYVDFSPGLEVHLKTMLSRRDPHSQWLFPSPQRGKVDRHAKTFRESLLLTRQSLGFDCSDCGQRVFTPCPIDTCPHCKKSTLRANPEAFPEHLRKFGFHDCRHHFISYCVMSGIDYMTIARWVGHKDGGVLIGKVYGHLSNEHAQRQARRINFGNASS
jgi:integrase